MRIQNLKESQKKKLGDLKIDGKIVAPNGERRDHWEVGVWCDGYQLTSLEGAPQYVTGDFSCKRNYLETLKGAPQHVGGKFWCQYNYLTSLEGAPMNVGGEFLCMGNRITSLEGAPKHIGGWFWCNDNYLTSLEGIHEQILEINGFAMFHRNPIKSHVLGLLLIKRLKSVEFDNKQLEKIINKYLPLGDVMECQNELIDAGLEEFAQI